MSSTTRKQRIEFIKSLDFTVPCSAIALPNVDAQKLSVYTRPALLLCLVSRLHCSGLCFALPIRILKPTMGPKTLIPLSRYLGSDRKALDTCM